MNNIAEKINTAEPLQDEFNLTELTRTITRNKNLSASARILGVEMLHASGRKGFNWYMIQTWADLLGRSRSQIHSYLRELVTEGIVKIHKRRNIKGKGYFNVYEVLIVPSESHDVVKMRHRKEDLRTENVKEQKPKEPVSSFRPPEQPKPKTHEHEPPPEVFQGKTDTRSVPVETKPRVQQHKKPVPHYLIREIINLTNDKKSFGLWYRFVTKCPEQTVYQCLDALKVSIDCDQVNHRGRYLVGIMKQICPEVFQGQPSNYQPPPTIKPPTIEPIQERTPEMEEHGRRVIAETRARMGWTDDIAKPI